MGLHGKSRGGGNGKGQHGDPGSSPAWRTVRPFPTKQQQQQDNMVEGLARPFMDLGKSTWAPQNASIHVYVHEDLHEIYLYNDKSIRDQLSIEQPICTTKEAFIKNSYAVPAIGTQ